MHRKSHSSIKSSVSGWLKLSLHESIRSVTITDTLMEWTNAGIAEKPLTTTWPHPLQTISPPQEVNQNVQHIEPNLLHIIQTSDSPKASLLRLTKVLAEAFLADGCLIGLKDRNQTIVDSEHWYVNSTATSSPQQTNVLDILRHPALEGRLITVEPVVIADVQTVDHSTVTAGSSPVVRAMLAIQTQFQGQINGVIILTRSQPYPWTETEVQRFQALSEQVAIAISQAQLQQQIQQQLRYQALIDKVIASIHKTSDLDQIFQLTTEGLVQALQVSRGFILLLKYTEPSFKTRLSERIPRAKAVVECQYPIDCDLFQLPCESGLKPEAAQSGTRSKQMFWVSECGICQRIFADKAELVVIPSCNGSIFQQYQGSSGLNSQIAPIFNLETMPSLLLVPLENQGTVLGCLALQHDQHRFWLPEDISFVKLMAAQISNAIMQTRTLRQVQSLVEERTAQLQHSLDVQAKLYEKTRQQIDQLRRLNQIREEFLSTMSHELLTPLTSMTLAIRMLRQADLSSAQQIRYLDILERQCAQETNLINDLLALQQLESGSANKHFQPLDIRYLIQGAIQSFEEIWAKKGLRLQVNLPERPLNIRTDASSLTRILTELLTNAGKYADPGSAIRLTLNQQPARQGNQVVLTLSNQGAGITPEEMPHIFDKFRRGQGVTQQAVPGTGLGLALVKGLVEHIHGAIAASSAPLDQTSSWKTCFTLTLPQLPDLTTVV